MICRTDVAKAGSGSDVKMHYLLVHVLRIGTSACITNVKAGVLEVHMWPEEDTMVYLKHYSKHGQTKGL